jgi:hypothetical protein
MLLAIAAFVQQGAMIAVSQAAAAVGSMPHAAVILSGPVHLHDKLAGHVHVHGDDKAAGHVHDTADLDQHDADDIGNGSFWSLGCTCAVVPMAGGCAVSFELASAVECRRQDLLDGVEPDGLIRPPSIPSIA